ncbi:hypothetical protein F3Y22_tig00110833pilonHSYRG00087 [Hibiscus syriacus]|uniref:Uncharacterized protein n=1 Tax=Hibiscus syriacus TaxID=106335 RepID=A0A6A2ZL39_HIBSY|nr:hypothetical protein F3Y22_tig00110833pilonHSYRG00087 [Hibiscus syriacus]
MASIIEYENQIGKCPSKADADKRVCSPAIWLANPGSAPHLFDKLASIISRAVFCSSLRASIFDSIPSILFLLRRAFSDSSCNYTLLNLQAASFLCAAQARCPSSSSLQQSTSSDITSHGIRGAAGTVKGDKLNVTEGEGGLTTEVLLELDESQGGSKAGAGEGGWVGRKPLWKQQWERLSYASVSLVTRQRFLISYRTCRPQPLMFLLVFPLLLLFKYLPPLSQSFSSSARDFSSNFLPFLPVFGLKTDHQTLLLFR